MQSHPPFSKILHTSVRLFSVVLSRYCGRFRLFSVILAVVLAVIAVVLGYFRSFFTGDSSDKIVMTFYLKSHLFISSATSHPILCRSHHRSWYCNAPSPSMLVILIFVSSPTRAWRTATATWFCIGCSFTDIAKWKKHGAVDDLATVSHQVGIARLI